MGRIFLVKVYWGKGIRWNGIGELVLIGKYWWNCVGVIMLGKLFWWNIEMELVDVCWWKGRSEGC